MAPLSLSTKRASSRRGLLGLIFLTIVCITAILAGALSYTQLAATNALRQSIPASSGEEAFYRLHTTQPSSQSERAAQSAGFEDLFNDAGIRAGADIHSTVYTAPVGNIPSSGASSLPAETEVSLTAWQRAQQHVTVVDGQWPAMNDDGGTVEAAISTATAKQAGLAVGQSVRLATDGRAEILIAAVFEPDRQARLVLNAAALDYENQQVHPVVVVAPAAVSAASSSPKISWTILPDPQRLTASQLPALISGLESLEDRAVAGEATNVSGVVGTGVSDRWVMVDESVLESLTDYRATPNTALAALAPGADAAAITAKLESFGSLVEATTIEDRAERIGSAPLAGGLQAGLLVTMVFIGGLCALIVVMTSVVSAPARNRLVGLLRTLGFPKRSDSSLLLWEIGPVAAAGVLAGVVLGLLLPQLVVSGVDLRTFTGGGEQPPVAYDPLLLTLLIGGFIMVVLAAVAAAIAAGRRQRLTSVLRIGEEV